MDRQQWTGSFLAYFFVYGKLTYKLVELNVRKQIAKKLKKLK